MRVLGLLLAALLLVACGGGSSDPETEHTPTPTSPSESPSDTPPPVTPKPGGTTLEGQPHEDEGVPMPHVPCDRDDRSPGGPASEVDPGCGAARYWSPPTPTDEPS